jgi:hypothetical protein
MDYAGKSIVDRTARAALASIRIEFSMRNC